MIVVGDPLHMSGDAGIMSNRAHKFGEALREASGLPVEYCDERLTSVEAETNLQIEGLSGDDLKKHLDSEAAAVILRDFLGGGQQKILVERP